MTDTNACHRCRRGLWGLGSAIAFLLLAISGDLLAEPSEIDSYDRAVTSQTKEDAIAFLREFGSSHLVGDLFDSLRPDVARQVCAEIADGISKARRACQQVEARSSADISTASEPAAVTAAEDPGNLAILKEQSDIGTTPRAVDSLEQRRIAASAVRVQLLSTKSQSGTEKDWRRLQAAYPDLLGNLDLEVAMVDLGPSKGVWYRGLAGPMASTDEASMFCRDFIAQDAHNQCIVADQQ
jgi:hypothetical protein